MKLSLPAFRYHYSAGHTIIIQDLKWLRACPHLFALIDRITPELNGESTLILTDDRTVQKLNFRYRGKNKPTNVLTFDHPPPLRGGDIILALQTTQKEAHQQNKTLANHFAHLLVHAILHLEGYDHHHAGEAREMEMKESRMLARLGLPNPWKSRHLYEQAKSA